MPAAYIQAFESGRLQEAIGRARQWMRKCTLCPRMCRVDRQADEKGYCRTGILPVVASYGPHFGEERPLVGRGGSGTIFFSHCNLFCSFCQNYEISHGGEGTAITPGDLAAIMLELQQKGCCNINFVTPTHVIGAILEALPLAVEQGLSVPLVYNCGGYERIPGLKLLSGIVDIYMPDFKFWDPETARDLCDAPDYPERARAGLKEMYRQVGDLVFDRNGVAQKGLLVRHLVMPNGSSGTPEVMEYIGKEISERTYVNVMDQYHPCGGAFANGSINRRISPEEFESALESARRAGLSRLDDRHRHWISIEL